MCGCRCGAQDECRTCGETSENATRVENVSVRCAVCGDWARAKDIPRWSFKTTIALIAMPETLGRDDVLWKVKKKPSQVVLLLGERDQ